MYNNNTIYKTLLLFKELLVINMLLHFYIIYALNDGLVVYPLGRPFT